MSSTMEVAKKLWKRVSNHFHLLSARVAKEPRLQFRAATKHGALYDMKVRLSSFFLVFQRLFSVARDINFLD